MSKTAKHQQPSKETQLEAMKIAKSIQTPGQTKQQTKLIAKGIQKGIQQYKKQYKAKTREWDKRHNKMARKQEAVNNSTHKEVVIHYKQHWLPWLLLALTWVGIITFFLLFRYTSGI